MKFSSKRSAYLAHCCSSRHKIREWELKIEEKYNLNLDNPFYDGNPNDIEVRNIKSLDETGKEIEKPTEYQNYLVWKDLDRIIKSDFVIAILDDNYSIGTHMEIFFARMVKKPVYCICLNKYAIEHSWIKYCSTQIFPDLKEFEIFLNIHKIINFQEMKYAIH